MNDAQIDKHKNEILTEGYTIIEDIVPHQYLDLLNNKMDEDAEKLIAQNIRGGYGSIEGHLQLNPPPFLPYVIPEVIANRTICAITRSILGDGLVCNFYSGNTSTPNSKPQFVHCDFGYLWKHAPDHPPANLVINLVFEDTSEWNGSTEVWPGSHRDFSFVCDFMHSSKQKTITLDVLENRRKISPPIRLNLKKGSFVIRDPRMWHRGMPNYSNRPRHMIAMIHSCNWVYLGMPFRFHPECKPIFDSSPISHNVVYIKEPFDYLIDPTGD